MAVAGHCDYRLRESAYLAPDTEMKILACLLVLSLGLNGWQRYVQVETLEVVDLQAEAIELDKAYWRSVQGKPLYLLKNRRTGDVMISVPYREKPYLFKKVCPAGLVL